MIRGSILHEDTTFLNAYAPKKIHEVKSDRPTRRNLQL